MRLVMVSIFMILTVVVSGTQQSGGVLPPQSERVATRTVVAQPGVPLLELLRPDDVILEIEDLTLPPATSGPAPGLSVVAAKVAQSTFIGEVNIKSAEARISTDREHVQTVFRAEIVDAYMDERQGERPAGVEFVMDGGEVAIGYQTIRIVKHGRRHPRVGETVLLFLPPSKGLPVVGASRVWGGQADKLVSLEHRLLELEGMPNVKSLVKSEVVDLSRRRQR